MARYEVVVETDPPQEYLFAEGQQVRTLMERKFPNYFWLQSNGTFTKEVPMVVGTTTLKGFDDNDEHYISVRITKC